MSMALDKFVSKQLALLKLEKDAEARQLSEQIDKMTAKKAQENGVSLLDLNIDSTAAALMGRCCYTLARLDEKILPSHSIKVGDEVSLYNQKKSNSTSNKEKKEMESLFGIVSKISPKYIDIICDSNDELDFQPPLRLDLHASDQTYKKLTEALTKLPTLSHPIINILFNNMSIEPCIKKHNLVPYNTNLNLSQLEAVSNALNSSHISLIHGPPGTGKTSTVIECIFQFIKLDMKLLVCCPSNTAVDTIIQRLVISASDMKQSNLRLVRLGHPARVNKNILMHCLDSLIVDDDGTEIVREVRSDIDNALRTISKSRDRAEKARLRSDLRDLRKEARKREAKVVDSIIRSRNVVLCTNVGASSKLLRDMEFDVVLIDEAAQALEASCWIPLPMAKKCILFGDHKQLPPTIKSEEAAKGGLAETLFERIMLCSELSHVSRLLEVQYRMNNMIAQWASHTSYEDRLISDSSVATHSLVDLPGADCSALDDLGAGPMLLIDTTGCDMDEATSGGSGSHSNPLEAELVASYVRRLLSTGLRQEHIGIVTPYNGQLDLLKSLLSDEFQSLEIRTVDGFQGGEKEAIIISFVRSNDKNEVGFLSDARRINVAVTRAKRHLAIVCNVETCSSNDFLKHLLDYISENGEHRCASEYVELSTTENVLRYHDESINSEKAVVSVIKDEGLKKSSGVNMKIRKEMKSDVINESTNESKLSLSEYSAYLQSRLEQLLHELATDELSGGFVKILSYNDVLSASKSKTYTVCTVQSISSLAPATLEYPPVLNSFQRMSLHALADKLKLFHRSVGDQERRLQVSKYRFESDLKSSKLKSPDINCSSLFDEDSLMTEQPLDCSVAFVKAASIRSTKPKFISDGIWRVASPNTTLQKDIFISTSHSADDDAVLAEAIAMNNAVKSIHKFRLSVDPMPNPDKKKNQSILRAKLEDARKIRTNDAISITGRKPKKIVSSNIHTLGRL